MAVRLAINGFGRVGRTFFKQVTSTQGGSALGGDFQIVAINDTNQIDSAEINSATIKILKEVDPEKLPWADLAIDIVVEASGAFESYDLAAAHLRAGAKRVVITTAPKDEVTPVFTPNVGAPVPKFLPDIASLGPAAQRAAVPALPEGKNNIGSGTFGTGAITATGSCTTNAVTPLLKIFDTELGIAKVILTSVHARTTRQNSDVGILPYPTGAALAATRVYPPLAGKFGGKAFRVPVDCGSVAELVFVSKRPTDALAVNAIIKKQASEAVWQEILSYSETPLSSEAILGNPHGAVVDLNDTAVIDGDLVRVTSWYDNEWGYVAMLVKHVQKIAELL